MTTTQAARDAFKRANDVAFGRAIVRSSSAKKNKLALKKMTPAQRICGLTADQLDAVQAELREDYLRRAA